MSCRVLSLASRTPSTIQSSGLRRPWAGGPGVPHCACPAPPWAPQPACWPEAWASWPYPHDPPPGCQSPPGDAGGCCVPPCSQAPPCGCCWVGAASQEPPAGCSGAASPRCQPAAGRCSPPGGGTGPPIGWVASSSSERPHQEQVLAFWALVVPQVGQVRCPMGASVSRWPDRDGRDERSCDRYQVRP